MTDGRWKYLYKERFSSRSGRIEVLCILQGPTFPAEFYAGPITENMLGEAMPRFNGTIFYHRTQDAALQALIEMMDDMKG